MIEVKIFDPPMCCATGVCGPAPNTRLIEFVEALARLQKKYGEQMTIRRGAVGQDVQLFISSQDVMEIIRSKGLQILPVIKVNGRVTFEGSYPSYEALEKEIEAALP